jgi:predicted nucleotidyltransferase
MAFDKKWNGFLERLDEMEEFQRKMFRGHSKKKRLHIGLGGQKNVPPYTVKPSYKRSKSAPPLGESLVQEISDDTIETFKIRDSLGPIWKGDKLLPDVREQLLKIAEDFIDTIEVRLDPTDIRFVGSLANYNWSEFSDIDIHIVVDYSKVDEDEELVRTLFRSLTTTWNDKHSIKIGDFEVQIYIEDANEQSVSSGIYSLVDGKWLVKPEKQNFRLDKQKVRSKAEAEVERIDAVSDAIKEKDYIAAYEMGIKQIERLSKMRKSGLAKEGEFSLENIVYKALRRSEEIDRLYELTNKAYDLAMTI